MCKWWGRTGDATEGLGGRRWIGYYYYIITYIGGAGMAINTTIPGKVNVLFYMDFVCLSH